MKEISVEGCDPWKVPVNRSVQINIWQGEEKIPSALLGLLTTQTTCSHNGSVLLWKVTVDIWHLWCDVLSPLCLMYPVLPVKASLTHRNSSCCWKPRGFALLCHSFPAWGYFLWHRTSSWSWHTEVFGSVQILYPDIRLLMAINWWEVFLFDFVPWWCPSK